MTQAQQAQRVTLGHKLLDPAQSNTASKEAKLYRCAGTRMAVYRTDGKALVFADGWHYTDILEDQQYLDAEIKIGGFGPAIWHATDADKEEYATYVNPETRRAADVVKQLSSNPALAQEVAALLAGANSESLEALRDKLTADAKAATVKTVTESAVRPQVTGLSNSRTIAAVASGSSSMDTPPVVDAPPAGNK